MRTEGDDRWRGALVLGICGGLSYYLTTGERPNALGLGLFLTALLLLLVLFFPPSRRWRRARDFYVMAAVALVVPWICLKVGYTGSSSRSRPAWHDLQERYPASGPAPVDLDQGRDVTVRRVRSYTYRNYAFKGIRASFGDAGAYLVHSFPLSLAYSPVQIPLKSIWRCQKDSAVLSNTTLAIRDLNIEIRMADVDGRILEWCGRHEIPETVPEPRR